MHVSLMHHLPLIFFLWIMAMIIKAITSMTPGITIPATCPLSSPLCWPCSPHSESVESVPGFIRFSPTDSHLKWEGPDNRFRGFVSWFKGTGIDSQCPHEPSVGLQLGSWAMAFLHYTLLARPGSAGFHVRYNRASRLEVCLSVMTLLSWVNDATTLTLVLPFTFIL